MADPNNTRQIEDALQKSYKEKLGIDYYGFSHQGKMEAFLEARVKPRPISAPEKMESEAARDALVVGLHAAGIGYAAREGDKIMLAALPPG